MDKTDVVNLSIHLIKYLLPFKFTFINDVIKIYFRKKNIFIKMQ